MEEEQLAGGNQDKEYCMMRFFDTIDEVTSEGLPVRQSSGQQGPEGARGFTLVELLVAVTVFSTAITVAAGIFVGGMRTQYQLIREIGVNNSVNLALEQLARDVRTGYLFSTGGDTLQFSGRGDRAIVYRKSDTRLVRSVGGAGEESVTSDNVEIVRLVFSIGTRSDALCDPWAVTVLMDVRPRGSSAITMVQTTVASRILPADLDIDGDSDDVNDFQTCRSVIYRG